MTLAVGTNPVVLRADHRTAFASLQCKELAMNDVAVILILTPEVDAVDVAVREPERTMMDMILPQRQ